MIWQKYKSEICMNTSTPKAESYGEDGRDRQRCGKPIALPQRRFGAIWIAVIILMVTLRVFVPRSVETGALMAILPLAAFLATAAIGQTLVMMTGGIDMSVPSTVMISSVMLLAVSGGNDDRLMLSILAALAAAVVVGTFNGLMVAVLGLNSLIVTLSVGALVSGGALWFWQSLSAESSVPPRLANFSSELIWNLPMSFLVSVGLTLLAAVVLRRTVLGRRFEAVGVSPRAAYATGTRTWRYQAGAYMAASFLYGTLAVLLSGFLRNPTLDVGAPYLLAPIAAAVLGGTAISGGVSNVISVAGASLFLVQLVQAMKMLGLDTSWQTVIQGIAIGTGMWLSEGKTKAGGH
ncbi:MULTISPECIES: ABC transporter permease [unclassified Burkholderia]|uniref:ABC transporter permease n=1 Tax=unclassified Burkholderia TaxID=2613784 RepID=UPI002AB2160E|nr:MULTISPECIES: ABC transporter permease [unclassified Burkholderia]